MREENEDEHPHTYVYVGDDENICRDTRPFTTSSEGGTVRAELGKKLSIPCKQHYHFTCSLAPPTNRIWRVRRRPPNTFYMLAVASLVGRSFSLQPFHACVRDKEPDDPSCFLLSRNSFGTQRNCLGRWVGLAFIPKEKTKHAAVGEKDK